MGSMTRCSVSALWLVFFALGVRSPAQDGEIYRLGVPARAGQGEGPLDWVYERVATSGDSWSGERSSDEVKAALDKDFNLGGNAAYIGRVADDQLGEVFVHDMQSLGVDVRLEPAPANAPTRISSLANRLCTLARTTAAANPASEP